MRTGDTHMDKTLEKLEARLTRWGAKIDALATRTAGMGAKANGTAGEHYQELTKKRLAAQAKLEELESAGGDRWESVKQSLDAVFDDLEAAGRRRRKRLMSTHEGGAVIDFVSIVAGLLLVLWALGVVTGFTMGQAISVLVAAASLLALLRIAQGRFFAEPALGSAGGDAGVTRRMPITRLSQSPALPLVSGAPAANVSASAEPPRRSGSAR